MKPALLVVAFYTATGVAWAQQIGELPAELRAKVEAAANACANFKNGELTVEAGAIVRTDLDGDPKADWVLNEQYFACSSAAFLFGSTGGTPGAEPARRGRDR